MNIMTISVDKNVTREVGIAGSDIIMGFWICFEHLGIKGNSFLVPY